ncbi:hypothetical protein CO678_27085 [Bradyrhizobium diazoefficiens]|uniref:terminase small subunit-like protein n=1 Tax=Bradyrhizobium diazoefficiens TaxID=1355477 RepID=UPI000BEA7DE5|nr:hypothetical protein [Bradyrhizobium diazoefficiens]PDT58878.1 hypothetical protein CO678_27085 [Bradyrhizobium diazoefficiens]
MGTKAKAKAPNSTGPYVEFTEEIFTDICERMANGQGLRKICSDRDMPSRSTFLRWVETDTGRQAKYQKAREALMDWYSEEILAIAWDDSKDTIKREGKADLCNHEWIARSRLKVDTLKFLMAKLHPKRYGDKLPEAVEDRNVKISWENERSTPFNKIELVGVPAGGSVDDLMRTIDGRTRGIDSIERDIIDPIRDDDGKIINVNDTRALRKRILQLEERLGLREAPEQPPKLLTYDPGPLPKHLDPDVLVRLVDTFKRTLPQDDQRPPETVLDEATSIIEAALRAHYGTPEAA